MTTDNNDQKAAIRFEIDPGASGRVIFFKGDAEPQVMTVAGALNMMLTGVLGGDDLSRRRMERTEDLFKEYRGEVGKMLEKHAEERKELMESAGTQMGQLMGRVDMVHQGLNRLEGRTYATWNAISGFFHFVQKFMAGDYQQFLVMEDVTDIDDGGHKVLRKKLVLPQDTAMRLLVDSQREVVTEAKRHEQAELARIKAQVLAGGRPDPMRPKPTFADQLLVITDSLLKETTEEDKAMGHQLRMLRAAVEANNTEMAKQIAAMPLGEFIKLSKEAERQQRAEASRPKARRTEVTRDQSELEFDCGGCDKLLTVDYQGHIGEVVIPCPCGYHNVLDLVPKLAPVVRLHDEVGRNEPCPCGSGKKFKKCCEAVSATKVDGQTVHITKASEVDEGGNPEDLER